MRRTSACGSLLAVATVVVVAIILSGAALAKGPSQAVIDGPGLAHPIAFRDTSTTGIGSDLASLVQDSGFWQGLWCRGCPSRLIQPPGPLGPRYTIRYTMTLEGQPSSSIVQFVYPYAARPVTYMPRGQPYWTNRSATGGWYVAKPRLRGLLIRVGLPRTGADATPASAPLEPIGMRRFALPAMVIVLLALVGMAVILIMRRRVHNAAAT